jgi:hypothetical protein
MKKFKGHKQAAKPQIATVKGGKKQKYIQEAIPDNVPVNPAAVYRDWPGWKKFFKKLYGDKKRTLKETKPPNDICVKQSPFIAHTPARRKREA